MFKSAPAPLGFDYGKVFNGPGDPNFGVLKLTPWRIEIFDIDKDKRRVWKAPS